VIRHVVVYREGSALVDRQTLAKLTGRSEETIRKKIVPVEYQQGKALYDAFLAEETLAGTRQQGKRRQAA
jgi:hypothetical protein